MVILGDIDIVRDSVWSGFIKGTLCNNAYDKKINHNNYFTFDCKVPNIELIIVNLVSQCILRYNYG